MGRRETRLRIPWKHSCAFDADVRTGNTATDKCMDDSIYNHGRPVTRPEEERVGEEGACGQHEYRKDLERGFMSNGGFYFFVP